MGPDGLARKEGEPMNEAQANPNQELLNRQRPHWENTFSRHPNMFGKNPSGPARKAAELFKEEGKLKILELGCGQGRDTLFLAQSGFRVDALDYSEKAVEDIIQSAQGFNLSLSITARRHDVRNALPFDDESFDACYSHMLYCMALTTSELTFLSNQIWRVLKPGGLNVYTARHTKDSHYGKGVHRGEDLYEIGGLVVHFFS
jgi:SAM-dependent methyltransferase